MTPQRILVPWFQLRRSTLVPAGLGFGMLAVVVAAALTPATGAVPADTSCPYGVCPAPSNMLLPWEIALGVLLVVAAVLVALILMRRRGRRGGPGPVEPWSGDGGEPPAGAGGPSPPSGAMAPAAAGAVAAAAPATYLETPEDVGAPPPPVPPTPSAAPGGEGTSESDIDSLMKELDKISNEILKRGGPKAGKATDEEAASGKDPGGGSA
jgi:hypothetical protein